MEGLSIGPMIRSLRRQKALTLQEVCDRSNLSVGFLSQVERGHAAPSLSSLHNIAAALGVSIGYFIATPESGRAVHRASDRHFFSVDGSPLKYCKLSSDFPGQELNITYVRVPLGYMSEMVSHDGEETMYVLDGGISVVVGEERYTLGRGDSIHFKSTIKHQWGNAVERETTLLAVCTLPVYDTQAPEG